MQRRLCFAIPPSEHQVEYKNGGEIKEIKIRNYPQFLYSTRPIQPYHFQADHATVPFKGLSHEVDFKNFDKKLHNLA